MVSGAVSILFASDFHGSTLCFKTFVDEAISRRVTATIIGGDLTGKYPTFIVREKDQWKATVAGINKTAASEKEFHELKEDIENVGSYPRVVTEFEHSQQRNDQATVNRIVRDDSLVRMRNWLVYADRMLTPHGIQLFLVCGNDDPWNCDEVISEFSFLKNPDSQASRLKEYLVLGESGAVKGPFDCPRDMSEEKLAERLALKIDPIRSELHRAIFVFHCPPKDTPIDQAFYSDNKDRTATSAGHPVLVSAGSETIKDTIEKCQPILSLHGHIHEADGMCKIGRTLCLNAGSEYARGILRAWHIILRGDSVADYQMVIR